MKEPEATWIKRADAQREAIDASEVAFFEELRRRQEPLGKQFEAVLFDNLWELYSR